MAIAAGRPSAAIIEHHVTNPAPGTREDSPLPSRVMRDRTRLYRVVDESDIRKKADLEGLVGGAIVLCLVALGIFWV